MKNKSGNTAFGAAAVRLMEQYEPENKRLFNDPVVYHITGIFLRFILKSKSLKNYFVRKSEEIIPGIIGGQICRTRYIDEKTLDLLKDIEQIMILGAGFDTRAYRLKGIGNTDIYEIDLPEIQMVKKKRLKNYLGKFPANVTFIPIDFNREKLEDVLERSSFDMTKPSLVILEAVTQYLDKKSVEEVFQFFSQLSNDSYLIFTYILKDVIERKTEKANKMMGYLEKKGSPFLFGINPSEIKTFLSKYNLEMIADVGTEYYQENYLEPLNRNILVTEIERINLSRVNTNLS